MRFISHNYCCFIHWFNLKYVEWPTCLLVCISQHDDKPNFIIILGCCLRDVGRVASRVFLVFLFFASARQFSSRETRDAAPWPRVRFSAKRRNEKSRATRKASTWFFRTDVKVDKYINQKEILKNLPPQKEEGRQFYSKYFIVHKVQL